MVEILKALADETRLRILSLIWEGEMCVCEIEESLQLTQSNASRHLTVLKNAGILSCVKHAQWAYYKLNEKFTKDHGVLSEYLSLRLKTLASYPSDRDRLMSLKRGNKCGDDLKQNLINER